MDYKAKAEELSYENKTYKIEAALRESAAEAYEDAASDVECLNSKYQPAFIRDEECPPCDDCVQGARLRGKAAALRAPEVKTEPCCTKDRHLDPDSFDGELCEMCPPAPPSPDEKPEQEK